MLRKSLLATFLLLLACGSACATPVFIGTGWVYFEWGAGTPAPVGGNPFTFTTPVGGATLVVTDAFMSGDQFEIFDGAISLGVTPWVPSGVGPIGDADSALADPAFSSRTWTLAGGQSFSINIFAITNPYESGGGYLRLDDSTVPEPGSLLLLGAGLTALAALRRRRRN